MTLNVQNIATVRDAILAAPGHFDMRYWRDYPHSMAPQPTREDLVQHRCGTVGCIGGWTEALFPDDYVADTLGIDNVQTSMLCYPDEEVVQEATGRSPYSATCFEAARVLDHLIETGEVDWCKAFEA
jgi:hypothetical protein